MQTIQGLYWILSKKFNKLPELSPFSYNDNNTDKTILKPYVKEGPHILILQSKSK